jgi:acyl carrier protein
MQRPGRFRVPDRETQRLNSLFREVFDDDTIEVSDDLSDRTLAAWDSFHQVQLVIAVQEEFGISLSTEEAVALKSVGVLKALLLKHGVVSSS